MASPSKYVVSVNRVVPAGKPAEVVGDFVVEHYTADFACEAAARKASFEQQGTAAYAGQYFAVAVRAA